ncbi:SDR family oxidoreductase [Cryptosporangium arvum]|uniref:Nucleoside-diphosphate-sugar epimerase n=1 Tax=Cryptosporangium arvum DSM 44712 TaxID=927661 RepID=A0A010ZMB5_9ACTN|nr:SDR family oxidoreductase [Cryptosporangium arvum]EXG79784.1 nucleoside-diphosphate-sugar epimerase [Cryptosporangium arvum DSM 44712]
MFFVTGASGGIAGGVVPALVEAGHEVVGLVRSDEGEAKVKAYGAETRRGALDDLDSLRAGAEDADGVVHLAYNHSDFAAAGALERAAIQTFMDVLEGTGKPFLFASGVALHEPGEVLTEDDPSPFSGPEGHRGGGEQLALSYAERGVRAVSLRFPPTVHYTGDHGFVAHLARVARERGASAYVGDGANHWSAVHRDDAATAVVLALEKSAPGAAVHAVAEPGIPTRELAEEIGRQLGVPTESVSPEEALARFGFVGMALATDFQASSTLTRRRLGWEPTGPTLFDDLRAGHYTP